MHRRKKMLLDFKCENFKSFKDGFHFNMKPESRLTELRYSILKEVIGKKDISAIPTSIIYGPNAAGKTSIINAMSCLRQIIIKGTIEDSEADRSGDHVSAQMNLIPFIFSDKEAPILFDITFTFNGIKYRYVLSFIVGTFFNHKDRYISKEELYINDIPIYQRTDKEITKLSLTSIKPYLNVGYISKDTEKNRIYMGKNMSPVKLLLTTDFYSFCSKKIADEMAEWFIHQFIVVNSTYNTMFYPNILDEGKEGISVSFINEIAKEAGIVGNEFAYITNPQTKKPQLVSVLETSDNNTFSGIVADKIESTGTLRLISIIPAILSSLYNGSVLVADELDLSLHPMLVMNIITLFHNDEVNKKHAQLIFDTHNPIYLNNKLFRRDEIKFVERDKETNSSILYALSDFKTNGEISVRKTNDYMKNYFVNRYGAIEDIDITDIVLKMLSEEAPNNNE